MVQENSVRNLTKCAIIEDGAWTGWEESECKGGQTVEGYICGPGLRVRNRFCRRALGGKYCQDEEGNDMTYDVHFKSDTCWRGTCPGRNKILKMF